MEAGSHDARDGRALLVYARRQVEDLADADGWEACSATVMSS
ncbi:MAG: hypothetical protein ACRDTD_18415 [Pseudonocardiaceae bacterium]